MRLLSRFSPRRKNKRLEAATNTETPEIASQGLPAALYQYAELDTADIYDAVQEAQDTAHPKYHGPWDECNDCQEQVHHPSARSG